jgi:hypothetical protein
MRGSFSLLKTLPAQHRAQSQTPCWVHKLTEREGERTDFSHALNVEFVLVAGGHLEAATRLTASDEHRLRLWMTPHDRLQRSALAGS